MSNPQRLHPIAAVSNALKQLKELILPIIFFLVFGSRNGEWDLYYLYGMLAVIVLVMISGILSWFRFTYRIEEGELRIEYGIFIRKKRYIPFERIQSFDFSEGIMQRAFGLVKVTVETAGSGGMGLHSSDAVLTAVTREDARKIAAHLTEKKASIPEPDGEELERAEELIYKIKPGELLLLASTSGGVGVVLSAVFAFLSQFDELIPYERLFNEFEAVAANGVVFVSLVIFICFIIAWGIALVGTMIKYAGFTVIKAGNDLVITRGLLEKRQFTIPLNRIQAVRVSENLLRQPFGYCAAYVESAGGSLGREESSKVLILPIVKKDRAAGLLEPFISGYYFVQALRPVPKRAFTRYLFRGFLLLVPIVAVCMLFFRPIGYYSLLLLVPAVAWSALTYRDAGWNLDGQQLTLRYRKIVKTTVFMKKAKIQSLDMKTSYFQQQTGLATLEAIVKSGHAGSGGRVLDLDSSDAAQIYSWYSRRDTETEKENQPGS